MNRLGHNTPPSTPTAGHRGDVHEAGSVQGSSARKPLPGTNISIQPEAVFTDDAVRSLIDEWLVPMLVKRFVDSRLVKQTQEEK